MKKKILVLASNPKGTHNLEVMPETSYLQEALQRSQYQDRFSIELKVAVRQSQLRRHILDVKPQIIHFCGHGTKQGLVLDDENGTAKLVSNEVLADLLRIFTDRIECVLLNACYSEALANEIAKHINYAIGMNRAVFDDAAIAFCEGFYDTLGAGESIERAFEVGKNAVLGKASSRNTHRKLTPVDEDDNPIEQNQEHLIPVLKKNPNPTPIKPIWLSPEEEREAVRQLLAEIEDGYNKINLFHTTEPIILKDQYIPVQVTLERRYKHTVETTWSYAESEAELKRIYALKGSGEEEIKRQQVDWQEARRQESRIVVLADPGMGKSTLLRREVCTTVEQSYQALKDEQPLGAIAIPLFIRLSTLADEIIQISTEEAILKIIQERHSKLLKHDQNAEVVAFLNAFLKEQLLGGKCLLLLDALDEVPQEKRFKLLEKLNEFARAYPACPIIGTARIVGYGGKLVYGAKDMEIVPFSQRQTEQYIETWFTNAQKSLKDGSVTAEGLIQALRDRPQIGGLAQNPLLLSLICSLYQRDKLTLPARRCQIYKESVIFMLGEWRQTRLDCSHQKTEAKIRLLEAMAYHFTCKEQEVFEYGDLYDWVEEYLEDRDAPRDLRSANTGELIAELSEEDGVLQKLYRDRNDDQYLFLHRTFQEYFTASYLSRIIKKKPSDGIDIVQQSFWNYDWHETLTLLAGLMEKPMMLIEAIDAQKDDIFKTQLLLLGRCIAECSEISHPLIDKKLDLTYQFWLTYPDAEFIRSVVVAIAQTYAKLHQRLHIALADEHPFVRSRAAYALGEIGNDKAVDALIAALADEDSSVIRSAAGALGKIGNDKAVDALIAALADEDSSVIHSAAEALGKIGNDKAVDALITALADESLSVRRSTAFVLGEIDNDKVVDALIAALADEDSSVIHSAAFALQKIGNDKAVDALIAALADESLSVRRSTAFVLGEIDNDKVVDALIAALADEDSSVRYTIAFALQKIGNDKAVDALIAALADEDSFVGFMAAEALGKIGNDKAVDALIAALADEDSSVRHSAAEALGKIGNDKAVDALIAALADEDSSVIHSAAEALGKISNDKAVDALITALADEHPSVRFSAAEALGKISNDKAVDALIAALADEDSFVRFIAALALGSIGNDKAVDVLIAALVAEDPFVRSSAAEALGVEDSDVRFSAAEALGEIGNDKAVDALIAALAVENPFVRSDAAFVLGEIGNDKAVDALIATLAVEDPFVRLSVAEALGKIGNDKAVDVLIATLAVEDSDVRFSAAEALTIEDSNVRFSAAEALGKIGNAVCLEKLLQSAELNIYSPEIFLLARSLAIRFSKAELPFIPVYSKLVREAETTE